MKEVEILLNEMDRLKGSQKYIKDEEVIMEQEEESNEEDEERVKKDIIAHSEDTSDLYMSPPSASPDKKGMIEDLMHLDQKINNYITNFRKKENKE